MTNPQTLVMGILNITPDSFADGGENFEFSKAISHAKTMIEEGVDIIDVGGESTRPGAERVTLDEELNRVIPVITELQPLGITISVDTMRSEVATAAIAAGATIVNDVSGGLADEKMAAVIAKNSSAQYVVMHWRGHSLDMNSLAKYKDVVREVRQELDERVEDLLKAGVNPEQIILDPGIGFSKTAEHNWELLRNIERIQLLGYPVLVGASRKRFLGESIPPGEREAASIAVTTMMARHKVWGVRTHSVKPHKEAIEVVERIAE